MNEEFLSKLRERVQPLNYTLQQSCSPADPTFKIGDTLIAHDPSSGTPQVYRIISGNAVEGWKIERVD